MNNTTVFDFSSFPVLATERLILREYQLSDASDVLVYRGDPIVQRFNGSVYESVVEAKESIEQAHAEFARQDGINWAVTLRSNGVVVGGFSFHNRSRRHRRAELGYDLAHAYWGQGIATEALRVIIPFGFNELNLHRIYASTIADNHESVHLLEKLGFRREGTRRESSWEDDGTFHDSALYGLLRREYTME